MLYLHKPVGFRRQFLNSSPFPQKHSHPAYPTLLSLFLLRVRTDSYKPVTTEGTTVWIRLLQPQQTKKGRKKNINCVAEHRKPFPPTSTVQLIHVRLQQTEPLLLLILCPVSLMLNFFFFVLRKASYATKIPLNISRTQTTTNQNTNIAYVFANFLSINRLFVWSAKYVTILQQMYHKTFHSWSSFTFSTLWEGVLLNKFGEAG